MSSKSKEEVAIRSKERGDVANIAIRNILCEVGSKVYGTCTSKDLEIASEYFDGKCPYTNKKIKKGEYELDHIIPQSKNYCGLSVKGNIIRVDKTANSKKGNKTLEDFMDIRNKYWKNVTIQELNNRIKKIKKFQVEMGYNQKAIKNKLHKELEVIYEKIKKSQKQYIDKIINNLVSTPIIEFYPENKKEFKTKLLKFKKATIEWFYVDKNKRKPKCVKSQWAAEKIDKNSNILRNIQTRAEYKNRVKNKLVRVVVRIENKK